MKKSDVFLKTEEGSAERVIAHAKRQGERGNKQPAMGFITEGNPKKALGLAKAVIKKADHTDQRLDAVGRLIKGKSWQDLENWQLKLAVQYICRTSRSKEEILQRIKDELDYSYAPALNMSVPDDATGREARELVRGLGGIISAHGAMVQGMMRGHNGETIMF